MSSSRSSSSSVRNQYSSNSYKPAKHSSSDFKFAGVKCKCDLPSPCQEAWKEGTLDPGRRFFCCSRYKDPNKRCNFFVWADPPYPERAKDVIKELKMKLRRKDDELHLAKVDKNFMENKMLVLDEEVTLLRKQLVEAKKMAGGRVQGYVTMRRVLIFLLVIWMMFVIFK